VDVKAVNSSAPEIPGAVPCPSRSAGTPRATVCPEIGLLAAVRGTNYISLHCLSEAQRFKGEGSIPEHRSVKVFRSNGSGNLFPADMVEIRRQAIKADHGPGPSVAGEEAAGGEA